jgi:hypothetical protein
VTLKLRTPDFFVVAAESLRASRPASTTKLEEDIAPLEVVVGHGDDKVLAIAARRSFRSRFARSTTVTGRSGKLRTLDRAFSLFPSFKAALKRAAGKVDRGTALLHGPLVSEYVFRGACVRLGRGVLARFALTLWYFGVPEADPDVAEISFKVDTGGGALPGPPARRAADLFVGLQEELGDWIDTRHASKTELALPPRAVVRESVRIA